ncbi:neuronal membrane glycoprotein M6-b-like [Oryctolagus cuniculus]|uniref:neuronal membrane glycoprotein M6-b-like n=1 Tax=Oryctolagus cuniculus TaxID=9986 RepID=UPI0038795C5E
MPSHGCASRYCSRSLLDVETLTLCRLELVVNGRAGVDIGRYHRMCPGSQNDQYHPVPTAGDRAGPRPGPGCFECCIRCLGGVPYASLVATILCFSGVALFCGCGHVALAGTVAILEQHFSTNASDHASLSEFACQLVSGVGRAGADTRCAVVCRGSILCGDCPLSGIIPWNAFPGKICGSALENICNTNEFYVSYHLFIVACAGAGATVVALVHVLTILSANWASLQAARDPPAKRDQELQDVRSPSTQQPHTHP